jgi:hypothetical protein
MPKPGGRISVQVGKCAGYFEQVSYPIHNVHATCLRYQSRRRTWPTSHM